MELSIYCGALDSPARAASLSERLLAETRARKHPLLYAYTLTGDVFSLGRFHVVPPPIHTSVTIGRRNHRRIEVRLIKHEAVSNPPLFPSLVN